ncbi:MAG: translation initiation factor IF-2 N-terminal domain-containing protein, partial [Acidimicrobiales bacterium]
MAKNIRVYELARELGVSNKEALDLCLSLGIGVKSHSSSIEGPQADRARRNAAKMGLGQHKIPAGAGNPTDPAAASLPSPASVRPVDPRLVSSPSPPKAPTTTPAPSAPIVPPSGPSNPDSPQEVPARPGGRPSAPAAAAPAPA